jgi:hypothetical protein
MARDAATLGIRGIKQQMNFTTELREKRSIGFEPLPNFNPYLFFVIFQVRRKKL